MLGESQVSSIVRKLSDKTEEKIKNKGDAKLRLLQLNAERVKIVYSFNDKNERCKSDELLKNMLQQMDKKTDEIKSVLARSDFDVDVIESLFNEASTYKQKAVSRMKEIEVEIVKENESLERQKTSSEKPTDTEPQLSPIVRTSTDITQSLNLNEPLTVSPPSAPPTSIHRTSSSIAARKNMFKTPSGTKKLKFLPMLLFIAAAFAALGAASYYAYSTFQVWGPAVSASFFTISPIVIIPITIVAAAATGGVYIYERSSKSSEPSVDNNTPDPSAPSPTYSVVSVHQPLPCAFKPDKSTSTILNVDTPQMSSPIETPERSHSVIIH